MSLLTEVNARLVDEKIAWPEGRVKQIGEKTDNLRKQLFFNPEHPWAEYERQLKSEDGTS